MAKVKAKRDPGAAAKPKEHPSKQAILDAAVECFSKYGPHRTSMNDIADAAGVSRKTVYRVFEDRPTLVEAILVERLVDLGERFGKRLSRFATVEEALVEGSILSVETGRQDDLISQIVQKDTNRRLEQFLLRPGDAVFASMCANWFPVIEKGRQHGTVRSDLSNERIVEIIISIHALLTMRDDDDPDDQRAFLKDVLIPAITEMK